MKYTLLLLLFSCKQHLCPPTTRTITKYIQVEKQRVDTLVLIQTYDSIKRSENGDYIMMKLYDETRPSELFKDGKRCDTIYRSTAVYY